MTYQISWEDIVIIQLRHVNKNWD